MAFRKKDPGSVDLALVRDGAEWLKLIKKDWDATIEMDQEVDTKRGVIEHVWRVYRVEPDYPVGKLVCRYTWYYPNATPNTYAMEFFGACTKLSHLVCDSLGGYRGTPME